MTRIESDEVIIEKSPNEVFEFLTNCNNLQQIMPEQVTDWISTESDCSFTIKGMASLGMEIAEKTQGMPIKIIRKGKAPFDFNMFYNILPADDGKTKLQIAFDADLNPFLKMMAEKPLRNFLNILAQNYIKISKA
jgi:carbon monoxide dehydrogenase subunit G